ncbi:MAG: VanZ family protein [Candidatus Omnitrophota bacterium]
MVFFQWLAVVMWAKLIYYLSDMPGMDMGLGIWDFFVRKSAHVFEFAYLTALIYLAAENSARGRLSRRALALISGAAAFIYAVSDEMHQLYVLNRHGSAADVAVDLLGIVIVCWLISYRDFFPHDGGITRGGKAK